jgi:DNA-binding NtrC family response regulator
MDVILGYGWPGNVRELENVMERAVALETTEAVLAERLPETMRGGGAGPSAPRLQEGFSLDDYLRDLESELVQRALQQAAGDRAHASRMLGITPRSLRYLIQKHRLESSSSTDP